MNVVRCEFLPKMALRAALHILLKSVDALILSLNLHLQYTEVEKILSPVSCKVVYIVIVIKYLENQWHHHRHGHRCICGYLSLL